MCPGQDEALAGQAAATGYPASGVQTHVLLTNREHAGLETSKQESGVPVAEFLNFLGRESVSSEPDFQDGVIPCKGLQEGFCSKVGDAVVGQLQDFQT